MTSLTSSEKERNAERIRLNGIKSEIPLSHVALVTFVQAKSPLNDVIAVIYSFGDIRRGTVLSI